MTILRILYAISFCAGALTAADQPPQASQIFDRTLGNTEREFVSLVAAMPADKFGFAPTAGKFDGVRNFGEQARHAAFVLNELAAALLGEKAPPTGPHENGPDNLTGKDQILQYVKDAFAHAHKAVAKLTNANLLEQTADPFNPDGKRTRVESVTTMFSHTFDHYGQMVEYARMNGIVPPASQ
jgi:uncharacterized damage-inducible protein DinB